MKKALMPGVTGQDGSYLVELLLGKGYEVQWVKRRTSLFNIDAGATAFLPPLGT